MLTAEFRKRQYSSKSGKCQENSTIVVQNNPIIKSYIIDKIERFV